MGGADGPGLREGLTTVSFGTVALVVATLCLVLLNFFARVLIVRGISIREFDAFSLGFTLTQVLAAVGSFGIPVAVARGLPYATSDLERRTIVRTSLWTGGLAAASAGLSLAVLAPWIARSVGAPELVLGLEFFAVAVASLIASTLLASLFQGFADVLPNALFVQILAPALFVGILAAAYVLPPGHVTYEASLFAFVAAHTVTLGALIAYTARRLPRRMISRGPVDRGARTRFLRFVGPLAIMGGMTSVATSGDTLVLGAYHYAQVGSYSASLTLARLLQVGIVSASYIFLPVASQFLSRRDARAVRLTYATLTKWLAVFSLPLFVVFFFLPAGSLEFVFGPSYATVLLPLEVVALGGFVGTLLGPAPMTQVAFGQVRLVAYNAIAAGVTDVGLSLLFVPAYGALGAGVAWASANVLFVGLCIAELSREEGLMPFGRDFVAPLVASLVPLGLVLGILRPDLPLLALPPLALGIAGFFVLTIVATRSVGEGDRLLLEAVERWSGIRIPVVRWLGRRLRSRPLPSRDEPERAHGDSPEREPPRGRG